MAVQPAVSDAAGAARPGKRRKLSAQEQKVQSLLPTDQSAAVSSSDSGQQSEEAELQHSGSEGDDGSAKFEEHQQEHVSNKGASFARAFSRILAQPDRFATSSRSALVLEEQAAEKKEGAHHLRQHLRHRNHQSVPRKGDNPQHDATEKALAKLATRGVVRLFNAVSKARQHHQAPSRHRGKDITSPTPANFLTELPGQRQLVKAEGTQTSVQPPGWEVLRQDFDPFSAKGGMKLKDWDRPQDGSESEAAADSEGNSLD